MAQQVQPVSFAPADFVAGGLINDVDVEVEAAEFTVDGPPNYTAEALFLKMSLKTLPDGEVVDQWWSCGHKALLDFTPSDDGRFALPTGTSGAKAFVKDSNFHTLMDSLVAKGFPANKCQDAGNFKGLQFHAVQQALKIRPGMTAGREDGRQSQVLVCERIIKLPGEKGKARAGAKPPAKAPTASANASAAPAAETSEAGDYDTSAVEILKSVLEANGGTVETKNVRPLVFRAATGKKVEERTAILKLVGNVDWLAAMGFLVDDTSVAWMD